MENLPHCEGTAGKTPERSRLTVLLLSVVVILALLGLMLLIASIAG